MENLLDEESNALGPGPSFAVQQFCDLGQIIPLSSIKKRLTELLLGTKYWARDQRHNDTI